MKKLFFAQILVLGSFIMFSACTEKGLGLDEVQPARQKVVSKQGILVFNSFDDFESTLKEVQGFDSEQRLKWEQQMGFKSFGSLADEVYESVEKMDFESEKEFYSFVECNSGYLQIVEDKNEETNELEYSLLTKEYNNPEQWLMNGDRMYIVDTLVYRFYDGNMAVVGPLERVGDLIDFAKLDTLKIPKDCFAYKYILEASDGYDGSDYPASLTNYSTVVLFSYDKVYNKPKYRIRTEIRAFTATTVTGAPHPYNTRNMARHYHNIDVQRKIFPFFNIWFNIKNTISVSYDVDIKSASLNYVDEEEEGVNFFIIGYASYHTTSILYKPPFGAYFDFYLWGNNPIYSNYPIPWTCFVAWKVKIKATILGFEIIDERSYSSGHENEFTFFEGWPSNFVWWPCP